MDTILQDMRYGLRMLWKHRFATFVCAGALALGMGANTAIFSMAEAFLLHPVPLDEINRLVAVVDSKPRQNIEKTAVATATYLEWHEQTPLFGPARGVLLGWRQLYRRWHPSKDSGFSRNR